MRKLIPMKVGIIVRKHGGARSELKHLSRDRKRNQRDSVSKQRAKAEEPKPLCVAHANLKF